MAYFSNRVTLSIVAAIQSKRCSCCLCTRLGIFLALFFFLQNSLLFIYFFCMTCLHVPYFFSEFFYRYPHCISLLRGNHECRQGLFEYCLPYFWLRNIGPINVFHRNYCFSDSSVWFLRRVFSKVSYIVRWLLSSKITWRAFKWKIFFSSFFPTYFSVMIA